MGCCRRCDTEIKPYQVYCPRCGAKNPLLSKEDVKEFKSFKKKFKPVFFVTIIILVILLPLFIIRIPVTETTPYKVKESIQKIESIELPMGCTEEDFMYTINYVEPQVFAEVLQIMCNIENLEEKQGIFEYTASITDKMSLEERQETSRITLGPYENKTVSLFFKGVQAPGKVDYSCKVKPPTKIICLTETERKVMTEEEEKIKTKQEKTSRSLFEMIFLKN